MREDGNAAEIAGVRAREDNILPRDIKGEISHFAQIEEEVDRPFELDRIIDRVLELLIVGQGELRVNRNIHPSWAFFNDNHGMLPFSLGKFSTSTPGTRCRRLLLPPWRRPAAHGKSSDPPNHTSRYVFHLTTSPLIGYFCWFESSLSNATSELQEHSRF